jgi:signal transduction histidine kinase
VIVPTETHAAEVIVKPPSRLSTFGLSKMDWALLALAVLLASLATLTFVDLRQAEAINVAARLGAPIGLTIAAVGLVRASRQLEPSERRAWHAVTIGAGVYAVAVGVRSLDGLRLIRFEGDLVVVISTAAVGIFALGIAAMPRLSTIRHTRRRAFMDAVAGSAAVGALIWELFREGVAPLSGFGFASATASLVAYVFLVAAAIFAVMRQERYRSDRPFRILVFSGSGLLLSGVASRLGGSAGFEQHWPIVFDLLFCVALIISAVELARSRKLRNSTISRLPTWKLAVPYLPVLVLVFVTFTRLLTDPSELGLLPYALVLVTVASGFSQLFAARENRELVGIERDQLITAVSQELRVPLTAVAGFSDVLAMGWDVIDEAERNEMVGIIQTQSKYLTGMITDMCSLVRDQLHTVELNLTRLDGKTLIADAVRAVFDLNVGPLPVRAQVEPYLGIVGDEQRLRQILVSLLKNAQRYGGGKILIVARREIDWRIIEVHDDGPGLSPRFESAVWGRFQRGEHDLNAQLPGSGLGLSIVRSLALAHGGTASYSRSDKLGGACFTIRLPVERTTEIELEWLDPV